MTKKVIRHFGPQVENFKKFLGFPLEKDEMTFLPSSALASILTIWSLWDYHLWGFQDSVGLCYFRCSSGLCSRPASVNFIHRWHSHEVDPIPSFA